MRAGMLLGRGGFGPGRFLSRAGFATGGFFERGRVLNQGGFKFWGRGTAQVVELGRSLSRGGFGAVVGVGEIVTQSAYRQQCQQGTTDVFPCWHCCL